MKKITLSLLLCGTILFSFGCFLNNQSNQKRETKPVKIIPAVPSPIQQEQQTAEEIQPTEIKPITAPDESAQATTTLINFFDYLSKNDFQSSVTLFSENGVDWEFLYEYYPEIEATNKAKLMETYCANTGTCLQAKVLEAKQIADYQYNLTVQFLNKDGTTYIFGPCCGATEEQMPSKDKFDFTVKKVGENFQVITPPLYRP